MKVESFIYHGKDIQDIDEEEFIEEELTRLNRMRRKQMERDSGV